MRYHVGLGVGHTYQRGSSEEDESIALRSNSSHSDTDLTNPEDQLEPCEPNRPCDSDTSSSDGCESDDRDSWGSNHDSDELSDDEILEMEEMYGE